MKATLDLPKSGRTGVPFTAFFSEDLMAAWDKYMLSLDPKPSKKALMESVMRQFLESKGFWPPRDD